MKAMSIGDLLTAMSEKYLPKGQKLKTKIIGLQQGENKHEKIFADGSDSSEAEMFTIQEIKDII